MDSPVDTKSQPQYYQLFGFVRGDVTGLFLRVNEDESVRKIKELLARSADIRTDSQQKLDSEKLDLVWNGRILPDSLKLNETEMPLFGRIDLVQKKTVSE